MMRFVRRRKIIVFILSCLSFFIFYQLLIDPNLHGRRRAITCVEDGTNKCLYKVQGLNHETYNQLNPANKANIQIDSEAVLEYPVVTEVLYPDIVVYNRVPKCASSAMRWLITDLKNKNHFEQKIHNWPNVKQSLTEDEEKTLVREVSSFQPPVLFLRHLHFVNFEKHNVTQPAYINFIRHPVDRFVSHYYFSRYGFVNWSEEKIKKWLYPMSDAQRNMSIDECVLTDVEKCIRDNRENMLEFFCGQDPRCRKHDDWSLAQAKENIGRHYIVIGILERMENSVKVLESILPRFFNGASESLENVSRGNWDIRMITKGLHFL